MNEIATAMSARLVHRGPDDRGVWVDPALRVALAHRRLAIVDLSPKGHQPMQSACGRYIVVFNGEIYNHLDLRDEVIGMQWQGHSDTETLLACFSREGVLPTLRKLVGMFAFAVWDREQRSLTLARDRLGEKPLYVGNLPGGDFVFASELKALRAHPNWRGDIDRDALALYLRHNYVPAPCSIFEGIHKLKPAHWLTREPDGSVREGCYWDLASVARGSSEVSRKSERTDTQAIDELETILGRAVRGQMLADVPLGAFLSGGVDSSAVVAMMCRESNAPVRTFSIGFDEPGFNEAEHAKAVARHLGTVHTEQYVGGTDALSLVDRLPEIYDEPFADASQIPTLLVCRMARQHVTVALSGDAGDELFAGYTRYRLALNVWHRLARIPLPLRTWMASRLLRVSPGAWSRLLAAPFSLMPRRLRVSTPGDKLHKFAATVLPAASLSAMYGALLSHWPEPERLVVGATGRSQRFAGVDPFEHLEDPVAGMCLTDQLTYLPDDILVKVDRAAMSASLETRVPLLDHRVVEFAWSVPMHQKLRNGHSKWLLRQVLYRHVPRELIERPKQGFAVPLEHWLRGPLRHWAEALLDRRRMTEQHYFDVAAIHQRWNEHLSGRRNWQYPLWGVLMFQAWLQCQESQR